MCARKHGVSARKHGVFFLCALKHAFFFLLCPKTWCFFIRCPKTRYFFFCVPENTHSLCSKIRQPIIYTLILKLNVCLKITKYFKINITSDYVINQRFREKLPIRTEKTCNQACNILKHDLYLTIINILTHIFIYINYSIINYLIIYS